MKREILAVVVGALMARCAEGKGGSVADGGPTSDAESGNDTGTACDEDGDGYAALICSGDDCDDANPTVHPGVADEPVATVVAQGLSEMGLPVTNVYGGEEGPARILYNDVSYGTGAIWSAQEDGDDWTAQWIAEGSCGSGALAVDSDGVAYVVLSGPTALVVATNEDDWRIDTVAEGAFSGASIAAGLDGALYVAYSDSSHVYFATNDGGDDWSIEPIWDGCCTTTRVALDPEGTAVVMLLQAGAVQRAVQGAGGWEVDPVDLEGGTAHGATMAFLFDSLGSAHFAFSAYDGGAGYMTDASGAWERETLDEGAMVSAVSLALGRDGVVHLVHDRRDRDSPFEQRYAWKVDDVWRSVSLGDGQTGSIDVDETGAVHVAYRLEDELLHARLPTPNGADDDCNGVAW